MVNGCVYQRKYLDINGIEEDISQVIESRSNRSSRINLVEIV